MLYVFGCLTPENRSIGRAALGLDLDRDRAKQRRESLP